MGRQKSLPLQRRLSFNTTQFLINKPISRLPPTLIDVDWVVMYREVVATERTTSWPSHPSFGMLLDHLFDRKLESLNTSGTLP